jgi:uncharacterized membrane protein YedE/YeeE
MQGQLAWYIGGPILGLCVVACRVLFNGRLGVTGGYSELVDKVRHRSLNFDWRGWFAIGILAGAILFAIVNGGATFDGYGWLTRTFHDGGGKILIGGILLVCGVLIGYGAKMGGGCTSGNGLSGSAMMSPASLVATGTFFGTAIVCSLIVKALT